MPVGGAPEGFSPGGGGGLGFFGGLRDAIAAPPAAFSFSLNATLVTGSTSGVTTGSAWSVSGAAPGGGGGFAGMRDAITAIPAAFSFALRFAFKGVRAPLADELLGGNAPSKGVTALSTFAAGSWLAEASAEVGADGLVSAIPTGGGAAEGSSRAAEPSVPLSSFFFTTPERLILTATRKRSHEDWPRTT